MFAIYAKVTDAKVAKHDMPRSDLLAALARAMVRLGRQDQAMAFGIDKNRFAEKHDYHLLRIPFWDLENVEDILLGELADTEPIEE